MISFSKKRFIYFVAVCSLVALTQLVFASESFQNNLLKTDISKNSLGGIKVVLSTSKPYSDAVIVNKKANNEYIILMPETSNSLTAKPTFNLASDVVRSVEVKTQQYSGNIKGYTKIVISTYKPVEIVSHVQTVKTSEYKLAEKDYKELIAQSTPKKQSTLSTAKSEPVKQQPQTKKPQAPVLKPAKVQMPVIITPSNVKEALQPKKVDAKKKEKTEVAILAKKEPSSSPTSKKSKPILQEKTLKKEKSESIKSADIATEKPKRASNADVSKEQKAHFVQEDNRLDVMSEAEEKIVNRTSTVEPPIDITLKPQTSDVVPVSKIQEYKILIRNNLYLIIGFIAAAFLILLLVAKSITKNIHRNKKVFEEHLKEEPFEPKNFEEQISEDMTWKEKFQTCVEPSGKQGFPSDEDQQIESEISDVDYSVNAELDELFAFDKEAHEINEEISEYESGIEDSFVQSQYMDEDMANVSADELFSEEAEVRPVSEDESFDNIEVEPEEAKEIIKSEFVIDQDKGFYLVDFEDSTALVGHIYDEIFVLKRFEDKVDKPLQARIDEQKNNSANYMTRVGSFKAIVEVTPENMKLLIEL